MTKLKTNQNRLVKIAVQGKVASAMQFGDFELAFDGKPFSLPSVGGIVYNVKTGDNAFAWEGDHIEPGVSVILDSTQRSSRANMGFNFLACVGNTARVVCGAAKGKRGIVTGHHGGVEHVTVDFDDATLAKLNMDDKILIEGFGQGLKLLDFPEVKIYNLDPSLLEKFPLKAVSGRLEVGVTAMIPAELMGSGMGSNNIGTGDCDVMTHDEAANKRLGLEKICLGDLVAIVDQDHSYGRTYRKGSIAIGVVVHSNSRLAGHGPGVSTLFTASERGVIVPVMNPKANLARILKIGKYRKGKS